MIMNIYKQFQPVTWDIGVIDATLKEVVKSVQSRYIPNEELDGIYQEKKSIDKALADLAPIKSVWKFLLVETQDKKTALFNSCPTGGVELPTWNAAKDLNVSGYYICNVPNTISKDQRSGAWGARKLEFRSIKTPYNKEPFFGVQVINDCGRWCFYRYGDKLSFEDEKAYTSRRKADRFTEEMLVRYCAALEIPVYDRGFYTDNCILVVEKPRPDEKGLSYQEARIKLRINQ